MDFLAPVFTWLMVHQPPFPWSLIIGASTFGMLTLLYFLRDVEEILNTPAGFVVVPMLAFSFGFSFSVVIAMAGYWHHWISIGLGVAVFFCALPLLKNRLHTA